VTKSARPAFNGIVRRYLFIPGSKCFIRFDETLAEPKPERYFRGKRLLLRELISRQFRLQAVRVEQDFVTNKSMQSILAVPGGPELDYILAVINSRIVSWYFLQRSNVGQRDDFPKIVLKETRSLPVPIASAKDEKKLAELSALTSAFTLAHSNARTEQESMVLRRQIEATDKRIDEIVYRLFQLTPEETALVDSATFAGVLPQATLESTD
jgi:hypothetical protein